MFDRKVLIRVNLYAFLSLALGAILLTGCGTGALSSGSTETVAALSGRTFGGQQPVSGSTVQFYAAGTTGYGSAARPLVGCTGAPDSDGLPTAPCSGVQTDSGGNFTIAGGLKCLSGSYIYVQSDGGNSNYNPSGSSADNSALALMAGIGSCGSITPATYIQINEVTTAATVTALQQFMSATYGIAHTDSVGAPSTNLKGLANAFATIPQLVNIAGGSAIDTASSTATVNGTSVVLSYVAQNQKLNALGNILSYCVNSGAVTGISSNCTNLFTAAKPAAQTNAPADTIQAMLDLALNPTNVTAPYGYVNNFPAFSPTVAPAPNDWLLTLSYYSGSSTKNPQTTGTSEHFLGDVYDVAVDSTGTVWVMNIYDSGSVSAIDPGGVPAAQILNGSLNTPRGMAIDTSNNVWVTNQGALAGAVGIIESAGGTINSYTVPANYGNLYGIAIDGSNNIFASSQVGTGLMEVPSGTATNSAITALFSVGNYSTGIALDSNSNLWFPYSAGTKEVVATCTGMPATCTYSSSAITTYTGGSANALSKAFDVAIDSSGNPWIDSQYTSTVSGSANSVTKLTPGSASTGLSATNGAGGLSAPNYIAIDGGNNIWAANNEGPGSTTAGTGYTVSEISNAATAISGTNGYYINMTSAGTPLTNSVPRAIATDGSGNIWIGNASGKPVTDGSFFGLSEIVGAAVPVVTPRALAVKQGALGTRP